MAKYEGKRKSRNAESKSRAINDGQVWTPDELDWLESWDGTEQYLEELAELLGRTLEACREKFYKVRRGEITVTRTTTTVTRTTTTTTYRGWTEGQEWWD